MNRVVGVSIIKILITVGVASGGIAAWALDHFETKEHVSALKEARDRELDQLDKHLDKMDDKLDTLLKR